MRVFRAAERRSVITLTLRPAPINQNYVKEKYVMVFEKVKALLAEQLDADEAGITEETKIMDDLGADSLDIVEMLMAIEDEFGVNVPDEDAQSLKTVGDVVRYIEERA